MTAVTRDELVEEIDLALAALRRVILRVVDAGGVAPPLAKPQTKQLPKPIPVPTPMSSPRATLPQDPISGAGGAIVVDLQAKKLTFKGSAIELQSLRQVQLAAVLLRASPNFIGRQDALARAWPDLAGSSRETTATTVVQGLSMHLKPLGILIDSARGLGLRMRIAEPE